MYLSTNICQKIFREIVEKIVWLKEIFTNSAIFFQVDRSSRPDGFCKKALFRNFAKITGKNLCQNLYFNKVQASNIIKIETLEQVFSCEFCKISKNAFSYRKPLVAASEVEDISKSPKTVA